MDADVYPDRADLSAARCATCGASLGRGDALCGSCGMPAPPRAEPLPPPPIYSVLVAAPAPTDGEMDQALDTARDAPEAGQASANPAEPRPDFVPDTMQRCAWCGAINSIDAERCVSCNAAFPKPEQDNLLLRASHERVRLALQDFEEIDRKRARSLFGRFFR